MKVKCISCPKEVEVRDGFLRDHRIRPMGTWCDGSGRSVELNVVHPATEEKTDG